MAPIKNGRHIFNKHAIGHPIPGETTIYDGSQTIDLDNVPLNGSILVKTLVLSLDPYMRGKMRQPGAGSHSAPYIIGEPLDGYGVAVVLRSDNPRFNVGDHVLGVITFEEYSVPKNTDRFRILKNEQNLPWSNYTSVVGMAGKTSYLAWRKFGHAKKGEVVYVSTGGGLVGSIVCQLAKQDGLKVIASTGSDDKVEFLKELGIDVPFNYKKHSIAEVLAKEGPIDIYWDNVGGSTLDAAFAAAAQGSRFIICGSISSYSTPHALQNFPQVIGKSITINGFVVYILEAQHPDWVQDFYDVIPKKVVNGELIFKEEITKGLEDVGEAFLRMMTGENPGKSVILVAEE